MNGSRQLGCPCGCSNRDECITRAPPAIIDSAPCDYRCRNFGLETLHRLARTVGACPCVIERSAA